MHIFQIFSGRCPGARLGGLQRLPRPPTGFDWGPHRPTLFHRATALVMEEETHFLYPKVKVAPLKSTSLARLEMQAAFLGSKSVESVVQQLRIQIAVVNAWTDSINVWYWLQKPSLYWKMWVAYRVSFIHETSTSCNITWRHWINEQGRSAKSRNNHSRASESWLASCSKMENGCQPMASSMHRSCQRWSLGICSSRICSSQFCVDWKHLVHKDVDMDEDTGHRCLHAEMEV